MKIDKFIDEQDFLTLGGSVSIVEICVEAVKIIVPYENPIILALSFSILISLIRLLISGDISIKQVCFCIINAFTLFLMSIGIYEAGIKQIKGML